MIKAIILDMDGLLIDSEPFWEEAEIEELSKLGVPMKPVMSNQTVGLRIDEVVEHWYLHYPWSGIAKSEVVGNIVQKVCELIRTCGVARPGANELIAFFQKQRLPMAIASSSPMDVINAVVDTIGIRKSLQAIQSAEHESYGKPHPGVFIAAAKSLGFPAEQCLVFEDTPNGVIAAKAARMKCVAVPYEPVRDDKRFIIADLVLDTLAEFTPQIFEQLS